MTLAHHAVEGFHQVLFLSFEVLGQVPALCQKMFRIRLRHLDSPIGSLCPNQFVQPPFVWALVREGLGATCLQVIVHHLQHGPLRIGMGNGHIHHAMAFSLTFLGKVPHGQKKGQHFLHVVLRIVRFLAALHHDRQHILVHVLPPTVLGVQLVTEQQPKCAGWRVGGT